MVNKSKNVGWSTNQINKSQAVTKVGTHTKENNMDMRGNAQAVPLTF